MKNWEFIKVGNSDKEFRSEQELRRWAIDHGYTYTPTHGGYYMLEDDSGKGRESIEAHVINKIGNDSVITSEGRRNYPDKEIAEINLKRNDLMALMKMAEKDKSHDYSKQIEETKKELESMRKKYALGNESIDKQEWTMFKGLANDAEKEIGNSLGKDIYQHKLDPEQYMVVDWDNKTTTIISHGVVRDVIKNVDNVAYAVSHVYKKVNSMNSKTGNIRPNGHMGWVDISRVKGLVNKIGNAKVDWSKVTDKYIDKNGHEVVIQKKGDGYYITNLRNGKEIFAPDRYSAIGIMEKNGSRVENEETKADRKFGKVMGEFKEGTLKTPQGKTVTDPAQAKAIAYSEADKVDNLKRARNAMTKNQQITLWNGNDSVLISENGLVQYLESNQFETDRDKYDTQEIAVEELTKKGYRKK